MTEERSKRKAAEAASEVLKNMLDDEDGGKENKKPKLDVMVFDDLFKCAYASEDSQLIEDDEKDVRNLFVTVEWLKDFGSIKAGTKSNAVALDSNAGIMEVWNEEDVRSHVIKLGLVPLCELPEEEWPEEVLADSDEEDEDGDFSDDYDEEEDDFSEEEEEAQETSSDEETTPKKRKTVYAHPQKIKKGKK